MPHRPRPVRFWTRALPLSVLASISLVCAARAEGFLQPAPRAIDVDEGEILLGELNCTACHTASAEVRQRLSPRGAPKLGEGGLRLSPQWLDRWLADPAAVKPGTGMPHVLADLAPAQRAGAVDELTHFLVSMEPPGPANGISADPARAQAGNVLFHSVGCVACHAPIERSSDLTDDAFARARTNSVPLGDLAAKYPAGELVRFLVDPQAHRPGGRMPASGLTEAEAVSIATYLLRDQMTGAGRGRMSAVKGLRFDYFEGDIGSCGDLERMTQISSGVTDTINAKMAKRGSNLGLRFSGVLEVPIEGEYTFWLKSDDGSQLYLDGLRLIDNDGVHPATEKFGKAVLKSGPHSFALHFFQGGGELELDLNWAGPKTPRGPVPAEAFNHYAEPMRPVGYSDFIVDPAKVVKGRALFSSLNCAACHPLPGFTAKPAKPLMELVGRGSAGCLADTVPAGAPKFDLSASQRSALRKTIAAVAKLNEPVAPGLRVAQTMTRFNCYACHSRDGVGGPLESGRSDWFKVNGEVDLGDEGRLPPHLGLVGMKLKPAWLAKVIAEGPKVRPYMATRMPHFGAALADAVAADLAAADRQADAQPEPIFTDRDAKFGWKLVGRDGLSCIACHTFTTYGSTGVPALGLDQMAERLQWDWFRRYLPAPAVLRPGTRMPTFWPEGRAVNTAILGGQTEPQINAIWAWLNDGAKAEVPSGLVRGRKEILVGNEAVIYRNFLEGAGSRAIGVGYPEHANLAFDANDLRLALLWQGSFIDASRHSTDRGTGYEPPLGDHVLKLPAGAAFAQLPNANAPWPPAPNRLAGINRFLGYRLDAKRQPTFRYQVGGVTIEDFPQPRAGELDMTLVRSFKLTGSGSLWFRAASGEIKAVGDGGYEVDGKLRMKFRGSGEPWVVGNELRVPVTAPREFTVEMTW
jgi:mono/diheme cytochrome c family protein